MFGSARDRGLDRARAARRGRGGDGALHPLREESEHPRTVHRARRRGGICDRTHRPSSRPRPSREKLGNESIVVMICGGVVDASVARLQPGLRARTCARGGDQQAGGAVPGQVFRDGYFRSTLERANGNPRYMWSERAAPWSCTRRKPQPDRARSITTLVRNPITGKRAAGSARATVRARARHSVLSRQKQEPEENPKEPDLEKRAVDAYLVSSVCLNARDGFGDVPRAVLSHSFTSSSR